MADEGQSSRIDIDDSTIKLAEAKPKPRTTPYTQDEVQNILHNPRREFSRSEMRPPIFWRPIPVGLPPSTRFYEGNWYTQREPDSCLPWAIVHASLAAGVSLPTASITDMLNHTIKQGEGVLPEEADDLLYKTTKDVKVTVLPETRKREQDGLLQEKAFIKDAMLIKETLDGGGALITSIPKFASILQRPVHAISIVGYRITDDGFMELQVIDPLQETQRYKRLEDLVYYMQRTGYPYIKVEKSVVPGGEQNVP